MIDVDQTNWIINQLKENFFDGQIKESNHHYNFRCPFCGDSKKNKLKKRGWLYIRNNQCSFYCYNCGKTCSGFELIAHLRGISTKEVIKECYKATRINLNNTRHISFDLRLKAPAVDQPGIDHIDKDHLEILPSWTELTDDCIEYLKRRCWYDAPGLDPDQELYYDSKSDRIVFPWRTNGQIDYYQLRALRVYQYPKYLFPRNLPKQIFGLDRIDPSLKFICFTEGLLDAIWIKNCVAVGGIFPTEQQLQKLEADQLIWFSDNFWIDSASKTEILKKSKIYPRLKIFNWPKTCPYKDINDLICADKNFKRFWDPEYIFKNSITLSQAKILLSFKAL